MPSISLVLCKHKLLVLKHADEIGMRYVEGEEQIERYCNGAGVERRTQFNTQRRLTFYFALK